MKEAIGGTSLFVIVIVILSVFAIYISISVNWTTAYKVKDEIIFYIEKNKGINEGTITDINGYLADIGYFNSGKCPTSEGWNAFTVGQNPSIYNRPSDNVGYYCIAKVELIKNTSTMATKKTGSNLTSKTKKGLDKSYYSIRTFFLLDLPIIRSMGLTIDGETKVIIEPKDYTTVRSVRVDRIRSWDT